jgi:hypothetical protein
MRTAGSTPGIGGKDVNYGESEFNYDIEKNFYKCHNVPLVQQ